MGGACSLGVLASIKRLMAKFVNGGGAIDGGGNVGSALATAHAKISWVERVSTWSGSAGPEGLVVNETERKKDI